MGGFVVDFIGDVRRIILAGARVGLVFAIVEIIDRIIGVIFGRVAVAERGFPLRIMASLKVEADEQAAGADRAAVNQAKAGFEFLVVEIERARANIAAVERSEEHTSELQSLMRISYAVFCLKQKKTYKR